MKRNGILIAAFFMAFGMVSCEEALQEAPDSAYQIRESLLLGTWASVEENGEAVPTDSALLISFQDFNREMKVSVENNIWKEFPAYNFFISNDRIVSLHKDENGIPVLSEYQVVFLNEQIMAWRLISYAENYTFEYERYFATFRRTTTADYSEFMLGTWETTIGGSPVRFTFTNDGKCVSYSFTEGQWVASDTPETFKVYGTFMTIHQEGDGVSSPTAYWLSNLVQSAEPQRITLSNYKAEDTWSEIELVRVAE